MYTFQWMQCCMMQTKFRNNCEKEILTSSTVKNIIYCSLLWVYVYIYIYVSMVALLMTCMYHILAHPSPSLPPSLDQPFLKSLGLG